MYYTQDHDPAYNTHTWSCHHTYNTHSQSSDPAYNMPKQSHDPAYNTQTQSQKCIRGVRMSNFGGLSVPVQEVMKKFAFISLLFF